MNSTDFTLIVRRWLSWLSRSCREGYLDWGLTIVTTSHQITQMECTGRYVKVADNNTITKMIINSYCFQIWLDIPGLRYTSQEWHSPNLFSALAWHSKALVNQYLRSGNLLLLSLAFFIWPLLAIETLFSFSCCLATHSLLAVNLQVIRSPHHKALALQAWHNAGVSSTKIT